MCTYSRCPQVLLLSPNNIMYRTWTWQTTQSLLHYPTLPFPSTKMHRDKVKRWLKKVFKRERNTSTGLTATGFHGNGAALSTKLRKRQLERQTPSSGIYTQWFSSFCNFAKYIPAGNAAIRPRKAFQPPPMNNE
jgi:hypothetical protein